MKKHIGVKVFFVSLLTLAVMFSFGFLNQAQAAKYNLKFQMAWHTQHPEYKAYQQFVKMIKKETDGELSFTIFPADQLVGREEALEGLKKGTIDMLGSCASYFHGMVPEGDIDWMPYISLGNRDKFYDFFNGENEFANIIRNAYLKKANAVLLTNILCSSSGVIGAGNKEYPTVDSLKNIKLRAAGGVNTRIAKAWGASPVTMATGEIYPALQMGTLDALLFYAYGLKDYKFYEVAKSFTGPAVYIWADDLWINADAWAKLPKNLQDKLKKVAREWARWASLEYWPAYDKEIEVWGKSKGVKFLEFDEANVAKSKKMLEEVWIWYANESPDCKRLVELYRAEQKKW
ncbi:MAG: TRAP transporter substrate-binding protein DctP [Syntrophales bacterium]|jgi:TRAP-type C4-dicarboxylate transport system substrate-binding protein|nr:TRAP transporter substrate-binding protein DctP [Syntrophales bacterium]